MLHIELENPSFEAYIKEFGKQEIEKMFLSFLEVKAKLNQLTKDKTIENFEALNVPIALHHKLLAMKPYKEEEAKEINSLIDKMSAKSRSTDSKKPYDTLRDEYFKERGYL
jgi:hypothetical protein